MTMMVLMKLMMMKKTAKEIKIMAMMKEMMQMRRALTARLHVHQRTQPQTRSYGPAPVHAGCYRQLA